MAERKVPNSSDREAVAVHQRLGRAEEEEPQDPDREACQAPRVELQARLAPRVEQLAR